MMGFHNGLNLALPENIVFNLDAKNTKSYAGSGTTAYDSISGTSFSLNNGVGFSSGAFTFDGTNDYIKGSSRITATDFEYNVPYTIEVICNIKENGSGFVINNRGVSNGTQTYRGWYLMSSGTNSSDTIIKGGNGHYEGGYNWCSVGISVADYQALVKDEWCHITYCFAGNNTTGMKIWLNGIDKTATNPNSDTLTAIVYDDDNIIQLALDSYNDSSYPSYSDIALARIYNVVLTDAQVLQNFNATRGRFGI